jgi:hypothetical protein
MRIRTKLSALALFFFGAPVLAQNPPAQPAPAANGLFSGVQVERGEKVFKNICISCHATTQFVTPVFASTWNERPVFELFDQLRLTMPQDNPGFLPPQDYIDVVSYLLKLLGAEIGSADMPPEDSVMKAAVIRIKPPQRP